MASCSDIYENFSKCFSFDHLSSFFFSYTLNDQVALVLLQKFKNFQFMGKLKSSCSNSTPASQRLSVFLAAKERFCIIPLSNLNKY